MSKHESTSTLTLTLCHGHQVISQCCLDQEANKNWCLFLLDRLRRRGVCRKPPKAQADDSYWMNLRAARGKFIPITLRELNLQNLKERVKD